MEVVPSIPGNIQLGTRETDIQKNNMLQWSKEHLLTTWDVPIGADPKIILLSCGDDWGLVCMKSKGLEVLKKANNMWKIEQLKGAPVTWIWTKPKFATRNEFCPLPQFLLTHFAVGNTSCLLGHLFEMVKGVVLPVLWRKQSDYKWEPIQLDLHHAWSFPDTDIRGKNWYNVFMLQLHTWPLIQRILGTLKSPQNSFDFS